MRLIRPKLAPSILARSLLVLVAATVLAGCASGPQTDGWKGGDPQRFADDQNACRDSSASVDLRAADAYSNPTYGAVAALANAMDNSSFKGGSLSRGREVIYDTCMNKAGWHKDK